MSLNNISLSIPLECFLLLASHISPLTISAATVLPWFGCITKDGHGLQLLGFRVDSGVIMMPTKQVWKTGCSSSSVRSSNNHQEHGTMNKTGSQLRTEIRRALSSRPHQNRTTQLKLGCILLIFFVTVSFTRDTQNCTFYTVLAFS